MAIIEVADGGTPFVFRSVDLTSSFELAPYTFTGLLNGSTVFNTTGTVPLSMGVFQTVQNAFGATTIDTLRITLPCPFPDRSFDSVPILDKIRTAAVGSVIGDPHFTTFAGEHYDFQGRGDYTLARSKVAGNGFDGQIRTAALSDGSTVVTATSATLGGHVVTFDYDQAQAGRALIRVDGKDVVIAADGRSLAVGDGKILRIAADHLQLFWSNGEVLDVIQADVCLDVSVTLAPEDSAGSVVGLLGSDDPVGGDFRLPDGTVSLNASGFAQAWSVSAAGLLDQTPIPEPASVALFGISFAALLAARRRYPNAPTSWLTAVPISRTSANSRRMGSKISACSRA